MDSVSLSPVAMFESAGLIGKLVMALLLLASVYCWVLIVEGAVSAFRLKRNVRSARAGASSSFVEPIEHAGRQSLQVAIPGETSGERLHRVGEAMARVARENLRRAEGGLPNLAVIASVAPFVGLFGTVWGIMTSFAGIAEAKDTSLAVVAPGIAEALAATAYGLAAAIPASIGYNRIGAAYSRVGQALSHYVEEHAIRLVVEGTPEESSR